MKPRLARLGYSLTLGFGLTLAVLWLASSRLLVAGAAGPWFVATTGSDSNSCLGVGNECLTIGGAVGKSSTGDVINIAAGTYTENVSISGKVLTLIGAGAGSTIVDGGGAGRVFDTDSDLSVSDLTIQNGSAASSDGGGLYATGAITLTNVNVFSSTAFFNGGGVFATGPAAITGGVFRGNAGIHGGGAYISNTLALTGTQFFSNTASAWGGGARALLAASVTGGQFQNNSAVSGGGLYADAALTLADTQFMTNAASQFGGGAYLNGSAALAGADFAGNTADFGGGAHFDGAVTVTGTTFFSNSASTAGGGAYFNAVATLTNTVFTQNLGSSSASGGGGATFAYTTTLSGGAFTSNTSNFAGGGAYFGFPIAITGTAFTSNTASTNRGGGAYFNAAASLAGASFTANHTPADRGAGAYFRSPAVVTGTDFVSNVAGSRGAGAYFFDTAALTNTRFLTNSAGVHGGGAYLNSAFQMLNVVFISNTAQTGNGGGAFQAGAGNGQVVNALFTRNSAGVAGADLFLGSSGTTVVVFATLASVSPNPGAAIYVNAGTVGLVNAIVANYAASVVITTGVILISDYNLFYNAPTNVITGSHSLTQTDPLFVSPASDNYRLGQGSPASGAGLTTSILTDLDGAPRGSPPSMGAYELPAYTLTVATAGTGLGTVSVVPSRTVYAQGSVVTLTAAASGGSTFAGWSGSASGLTNPLTITMTSAKSLTATFDLIPPTLADLAIDLRAAPSQAAPNGLVTYTLVVTNTGPAAAASVRLTDTLSVSSTFQSLVSPGGWSCLTPGVGGTGAVVCTAGSLSVGAHVTFTLTVQLRDMLPAAAVISNTATVSSAQPDPTTPNTATATTQTYAFRRYVPFLTR